LYASVLTPTALISARTPANLTQFASITTCAVTLFVGLWRRRDLQELAAKLDVSPAKKTFVFGGVGAVYVETVYEVWQHVFGASGVAANANLALDLVFTMPWYLLLVAFLAVALEHVRPSLFQLLLLGGVYECMADGLLSSVIGGRFASIPFLPLVIPVFTIVYAPIVVLPAIATRPAYEAHWRTKPPLGSWLWMFFPCSAILLYGPLLIVLLFR
jgi:hypothetical protein